MSITLYTTSPEQTRSLGRSLGKLLQAGDIVCLQGDLGSGKTCMAQGIGSGRVCVAVLPGDDINGIRVEERHHHTE